MRRIDFFFAVWLVSTAAALHAGEADPPKPPDAEAAVNKALGDIENSLKTGNVGWWQSEADPWIQFTAKYTGFGGDVVTALSLNQAEAIWPAYKGISEKMDQFGAACVVYNCLQYAYDGEYNKAALEGMKWFLMNRLKQMGEHGAISASGVGLIDFALNSFAEAAMQQIKDDYWAFYCAYQTDQHRHLGDYLRMFENGEKGLKGMPAIAASLDSFWETPEAQGIRGYYTLKVQDPQYIENFRNRFIKEFLLQHLVRRAEIEQEKARTDAWLAAKKYAEQIQATTFVVDLPIRERNLGEAPVWLTADLYVNDPAAKDGMRILVSAPVANDLKLEAPLSALFNDKKQMPTVVHVKLHRAGAQDPKTAPAPDPETIDIYLSENNPKWKREAKPGKLIYKPRNPILVATRSNVRVRGGGTGTYQITWVSFHPLPIAGFGDMTDNTIRPNWDSCRLTDGQGTTSLANGRYVVVTQPALAPETVITVKGDMDVTLAPMTGGEVAAPKPPDPARFRELTRKVNESRRSRSKWASDALAETAEARAAFWQESIMAFGARERSALLLEIKRQADMRQPGVTPAQAAAIDKAAQAKIAEVRKGTDEASAALGKVATESLDEIREIEKEQTLHIREVAKEFDTSRMEVDSIANKLGMLLYPTERSFLTITRGVTQGGYYTISGITHKDDKGTRVLSGPEAAEERLEEARKGLAQIEKDVPQIIAVREKLREAAARHVKAVAAVREVNERDGVPIYPGEFIRQDDVNAIMVRADIQGNPKVVEEARDYVKRGERMVQRRKERLRVIEEALRKVIDAAAQLKDVDAAAWKTRTGEFTAPLDALFAAAEAAGGADDTESFRKLAESMDGFFREQIDVCGDLLEDPDKKDTPFSRFHAAHQALLDLGAGADWPKDFQIKTINPAVQKVNARGRAVSDALRARKDIRLWLALGKDRAERSAARKRFIEGFAAKTEPKNVEQRLADVEARVRLIQEFPHRVPAAAIRDDLVKRLEDDRRALAASGEVEDLWRSKNEPFVVFDTVNGKPFKKAFYWNVEESHKLPNDAAPEAVLKVVGAPEDAPVIIRRSDDGGRTWRNMVPVHGRIFIRLPIGPKAAKVDSIFMAVVPGRKSNWSAALPNFHLK
jgi:hypothetical protein